MTLWHIFNTNKLLRKAKHHIEAIEKLNDDYRVVAIEQNKLIADANERIRDCTELTDRQSAVIQDQAATINDLRIKLANAEAQSPPATVPGHQPDSPW